MKGWWYREAVDHALLPARVTLEQITAERKEIYRAVPPPWGGDDSYIRATLPYQRLYTYI